MDTNWKRPKELPSQTIDCQTPLGHVFLTMGYEDDERTRLVEVFIAIGKAGNYSNIMFNTYCKLISIILQSPEPRYKIVKKFKKQFFGVEIKDETFVWKEVEYGSVIDFVAQVIVEELNKQIGG